MNLLSYFTVIILSFNAEMIFDFNHNSDIRDWRIVNDVVMGGKSSSTFKIDPDGYGIFEGKVSLANNGGFASVRYQFGKVEVHESTKMIVKVKGDGKKYQFRIKNSTENYYSYIISISTSGNWQQIEIALKDMVPSFRGRKLDQPNFAHDNIEEIAILIGNKKAEDFRLLIDNIELK